MGTPFDVNFVDIAFAWHSEQVLSALALCEALGVADFATAPRGTRNYSSSLAASS